MLPLDNFLVIEPILKIILFTDENDFFATSPTGSIITIIKKSCKVMKNPLIKKSDFQSHLDCPHGITTQTPHVKARGRLSELFYP